MSGIFLSSLLPYFPEYFLNLSAVPSWDRGFFLPGAPAALILSLLCLFPTKKPRTSLDISVIPRYNDLVNNDIRYFVSPRLRSNRAAPPHLKCEKEDVS